MLWGLKTVAVFDAWTFEHLVAGISIGAIARKCNRRVFENRLKIDQEKISTSYFDLIAVLLVAYMWESIEHYLEIGIAGQTVKYWFYGVEYWANRLVADPLLLVAGYYLAKSYPYLVNPARAFSILWLIVHVFVFPHSMHLHELF